MSKARGLVFGAAILLVSSLLDINIFGNFKVSSLLDTGILHIVRAATSTTTTMKLKDLPIGGVISLGAYNYVKIADNQFMQTEVATCPDGKTVAGKYVKCFDSDSAYTQTCTGSYYCNTSNTAWNSSTGKCDSSVTCPDGGTYCGDNSSWDTTSSKCVAADGSTYCATGLTWNSSTSKCEVMSISQCWRNSSDVWTCTTCPGTIIGGYCWSDIASSTYTWADRDKGCASGYSVPTVQQFRNTETALGCSSADFKDCSVLLPAKWGGSNWDYWTASEYNSSNAYNIYVYYKGSYVGYYHGKTDKLHIRCIKD